VVCNHSNLSGCSHWAAITAIWVLMKKQQLQHCLSVLFTTPTLFVAMEQLVARKDTLTNVNVTLVQATFAGGELAEVA
jgi:hypothetical protein